MEVANIIRDLRLAKKLTQPELARRIGVSERAVRSWEKGIHKPSLSQYEHIASALGFTTWDDLVASAEPPAGPAEAEAETARNFYEALGRDIARLVMQRVAAIEPGARPNLLKPGDADELDRILAASGHRTPELNQPKKNTGA